MHTLVGGQGGRDTGWGGLAFVVAAVALVVLIQAAYEAAAVAEVERSDDPAQGTRHGVLTFQGLARGSSTRMELSTRGTNGAEVCCFHGAVCCAVRHACLDPSSAAKWCAGRAARASKSGTCGILCRERLL